MVKYKVTNDKTIIEFQTEQAAQDYANANGGDVSSFTESIITSTTADQVQDYLDRRVFPFIKSIMNRFAAENVSMGVTQANKTGDILSIFSKQYPIASLGGSYSIKDTFDTGSLYGSLTAIQYIRDNPSEYAGLSPFITDARLLKMKNDIERFLGITLST